MLKDTDTLTGSSSLHRVLARRCGPTTWTAPGAAAATAVANPFSAAGDEGGGQGGTFAVEGGLVAAMVLGLSSCGTERQRDMASLVSSNTT